MIKNGAEYIATLRDGRAVYLDGGKIEDVTAHPAFRPRRPVGGAALRFPGRARQFRPDDL